MLSEEIVKRVKQLLLTGASGRSIAKEVGVRRETIIFLEKGKYNPSLQLAYNIARVLKTSISEIFIFEDED